MLEFQEMPVPSSAILDSINALVAVLDGNGRILELNKALAEVAGYDRESIRSRQFGDIFLIPEEQERFRSLLDRKALSSSGAEFEGFWENRNGVKYALSWTFATVPSNNGGLIVATGTDNSTQKQMGILLNYTRDRYLNFFEVSRDVYFRLDMQGHIIAVSPSIRHYGFNVGDLIGRPVTELYGENRQWRHIYRMLRKRGSIEDYEIRLNNGSGELLEFSLNAHIIKGKTETPVAVEGLLRDVRRRKRAEMALQSARDEFITILTHDLKNPLSAMMSYVDLLEKTFNKNLNGNGSEILGMIRQSGHIMFNLINNILSASRIESGAMSFTFEDFRLDNLFRHLKEIFGPLAARSRISLEISVPEGIMVNGDWGKLRQVFFNLIVNAINHTPENGVIRLVAEDMPEGVLVSVQDTGNGIPESEQKKIFEKFSQALGEKRGSGIGLYIVKKFLTGHGSEVQLESRVGMGTKFSFILKEASRRAAKARHLLVACEEDYGHRQMCIDLQDRGFTLEKAYSGLEALQKAQLSKPDLVIVCHELPDLSAVEFNKSMKLNPGTKTIPVLLVAGKDDAGSSFEGTSPCESRKVIEEIDRLLMQ